MTEKKIVEMTPPELRRHAAHCADQMGNWAAGAIKAMNTLMPQGTRVEVKLSGVQKVWSKGTVHSCGVTSHGCHAYPFVKVEIDNAKARSRQRFRSIPLASVRRLEDVEGE